MGGGMDHGGETVFFVFSFTLSNRMRVINYQPSSPTARKSQSEPTIERVQCAPPHMLPLRTLRPTFDPS